ncbi:ABC transporter permease [Mucisphaera calidilacus]
MEVMSQWRLILRRFLRHRLAVISTLFLIFIYSVAIFAEPLAVNPPNQRNLDHVYCPPQLLLISTQHGLYTYGYEQQIDPVTFRKSYLLREDVIVPVRLLGRGAPYKLWGLIPLERHLLTVSAESKDADHHELMTYYPLGTDELGRCILSRAVYGARVSLSVGIIGIGCTFVFGIVIGSISGYLGGRADNLIQRSIEIINSFPHLPLWIALAALLPPEWSALKIYFAITVLLSLLNWTGLARVVRGKILSLREEDYAVAARLLGASHTRVLFLHLLPGFTSHIIVALTLAAPAMILGETSLSFLGLGLRPPIVSWGVMLQDCLDVKAVRFYPWLLMPVVFIITTVLSFNFLGDGLRDAADPYEGR